MPEQLQDNETYILFELAGTTYGVRSREVMHMEMVEKITPVPNGAYFLEGVVFSRGKVVPVVNLRVRFDFPREPHTLKTRLIVVQHEKRSIGLLVDSAREFRVIPGSKIQATDGTINGATAKFLAGIANIGDRLVLLLNLQSTLKLLDADAGLAAPEMATASEQTKL